jgi:D-alanyl-D-alanine carboxypeptidase/D-alanyl-D-alanine-endopeptidase (penicillin-binding protein 4)
MRSPIALLAVLAFASCGPQRRVEVSPPAPSPPPPVAPSAFALAALQPQTLPQELAAIFGAPEFDRALWSVAVRPLSSGENLFALNAEKLVMPASTMKVLTAAAAVEGLGWDYRFETRLASLAAVESGILRGDLIIVGGGDPTISERTEPGVLRTMARQLRDAGITAIEGRVIGHDDRFEDKAFGDGWTLDNLPYGYAAPVSALQYNDGAIDLVITAGSAAGQPVRIQPRPEGSGLQIENLLVTVGPTGTGMMTLERVPGSQRLLVRGQIPAGSAPFARTASVDNPTAFFAAAFRGALVGEGIGVTGEAIDADDLPSKPDITAARTIVSRRSAPLSEIIASMMRVSQNQYAEILLRELGVTGAGGAAGAGSAPGAGGAPGAGTVEAGKRRVRQLLAALGIPEDSYAMADASGMSRYNYVTADALVRLLQLFYERPAEASVFPGTLPTAGREGTLVRRLVGTPAEGRVRAKSGSVDNVRALCGYVDAADGRTLVFSMIANNFTGPTRDVDAAIDRALVRLAAYGRAP